jgi:hypothetical protein
MKPSILSLAPVAALARCLPITSNAAPQVYDLKTDWSDIQNPNGAWSYRSLFYGELMINDPFAWVSDSYPNLGWITKVTPSSAVPGYLEVGDISLGTVDSLEVILRWTAPARGTIAISAAMWEASPGIIHFTGWALLQNGSLLNAGNVDGSRGSPDGVLFQDIPVQAGDAIDLSCQDGLIGINLTVTFTSESDDPVSAIEDLAFTVFEMNLQNGIENSLATKLDAALNALVDANVSNDGAACNSLEAFINAVEAQRGKKITSAQADELIAAAEAINELLDCNT